MKALFRGKRIDNQEWIEGYCVRDSAANLGIDYAPLSAASVCDVIIENGTMWYVHPETVGQYTGLDDRNGVKIFDGDLCGIDDCGIAEVVWDGYMFAWRFSHGDDYNQDDLAEFESPDIMVLSSIHDEEVV